MTKRVLAALVVLGAFVATSGPAVASDGTTCSYTQSDGSPTSVAVYPDTSGSTGGMSGQADSDVGVCVDSTTSAGGSSIDGGSAEAGASTTQLGDAYVVVDGDNNNSDPTGQSDGYAGVSTFESGTQGTCSGGGTGTNSGGCLSVNGTTVSGSPVVCGNDGGNTWSNTTQDGCSISQTLPPPPPLYPCPVTTVGTTTVNYYWTTTACPVGPTPPPTLRPCPLATVGSTTVSYYTLSTTSCPVGPLPPPPTIYSCSLATVNGTTVPYFYTSPICPVGPIPIILPPVGIVSCSLTLSGETLPYYAVNSCPPLQPTADEVNDALITARGCAKDPGSCNSLVAWLIGCVRDLHYCIVGPPRLD